jgi:hypothetical protein
MAPLVTSVTVPSEPFFHSEIAVVLEKHYPVTMSENSLRVLDHDCAFRLHELAANHDRDIISELAVLLENFAGSIVEVSHVCSGVGQNQRASIRFRGEVLRPFLN